MTLSPQRLEKAAEAIWRSRQTKAKAAGIELDDWRDEFEALREEVRADAHAAISAYLGDTHVDVPREPTEAMVDAAYESFGCHEIFRVEEIEPNDIYRAMLSAELTERDAG